MACNRLLGFIFCLDFVVQRATAGLRRDLRTLERKRPEDGVLSSRNPSAEQRELSKDLNCFGMFRLFVFLWDYASIIDTAAKPDPSKRDSSKRCSGEV